MSAEIHVLDVVALLDDLPENGLRRGQVGTVVESLDAEAFEVEFADEDGRTYASLAVRAQELMPLHYQPAEAV
jgi:hypothetical protein